MSEDLLARIQREIRQRLGELRRAVGEHDRLQDDLRALQALPGSSAEGEACSGPQSPVVLEPPLASRQPDLPDSLVVAESSPANDMRSPAMRSLPRTPAVSPKVARLMRSPRRPSVLRWPGVPCVDAGTRVAQENDLAAGVDLFPGVDPCLGLDEVDVEAERYERSL
jgi:hypothetical protein